MTVQECYQGFGGDYEGVLSRLMKEERVLKYLNKFSMSNDLEQIELALKGENYEEAFRLVHNLKGVALNLGLTPLHQSSDILCEAVRHGKPTIDITGMLSDLRDTWATVQGAIRQIL